MYMWTDQSESDDENSDVFQESHQEFTLPSSSSMVVSSNTEHHPLPVGAKGWSEEEAASHKAFVTPRDSQTSPPMLVSDYSRPSECGREGERKERGALMMCIGGSCLV